MHHDKNGITVEIHQYKVKHDKKKCFLKIHCRNIQLMYKEI